MNQFLILNTKLHMKTANGLVEVICIERYDAGGACSSLVPSVSASGLVFATETETEHGLASSKQKTSIDVDGLLIGELSLPSGYQNIVVLADGSQWGNE